MPQVSLTPNGTPNSRASLGSGAPIRTSAPIISVAPSGEASSQARLRS